MIAKNTEHNTQCEQATYSTDVAMIAKNTEHNTQPATYSTDVAIVGGDRPNCDQETQQGKVFGLHRCCLWFGFQNVFVVELIVRS
jgi:beta-mannanase